LSRQFRKVARLIITGVLLLPLSSFASFAVEKNAPLNDKQEELLKLFLPSLFKTTHPTSSPSASLNKEAPKLFNDTKASLTGDIQNTVFSITFPKRMYYDISSDETHQLITINFRDIDPTMALPEFNTLNTAVEKIAYNVGNDNQLVVTLLLAPNVDVKGLRMDGNHPAEFVMDLGLVPDFQVPVKTKAVKTPGHYQPLVKKPVKPSSDELLQKNIDDAVTLLSQQHATEALKLLKISMPRDIASHVDYYIVLAEANRQSGHVTEALHIYQQLIKQEPNNADWQVGLGMCYDMLNQKTAAMNAYNKALALGNLSPSLQQYVNAALKRGA